MFSLNQNRSYTIMSKKVFTDEPHKLEYIFFLLQVFVLPLHNFLYAYYKLIPNSMKKL